ncbi:MAG: hypothetical protein P4M05_01515 [Bradyrhizobium sp.]|nr:hypothetical protein [Bradyrhizobium sp.]
MITKKPAYSRKPPAPRPRKSALAGRAWEDGWRAAIEWLGSPAERREAFPPGHRYFYKLPPQAEEENISCELPYEATDAIAHVTKIQSVSQRHFRAALTEICDDIYSRDSFHSALDAPRPLVLLNRVAKSARQLSTDLFRVAQSGCVLLDGTLLALLPRVLLKARLNTTTNKIEVGCDRSWVFLDDYRYADLLSGLADCASVAAEKMPMAEAARRLGVRIRIKPEAIAALKATAPPTKVRNVLLHVLVQGLHALIVDKAHGKLTLWNDPEDTGPKGTLPAVLKILRRYLPDVVPVTLNYKTLRRYLKTKS